MAYTEFMNSFAQQARSGFVDTVSRDSSRPGDRGAGLTHCSWSGRRRRSDPYDFYVLSLISGIRLDAVGKGRRQDPGPARGGRRSTPLGRLLLFLVAKTEAGSGMATFSAHQRRSRFRNGFTQPIHWFVAGRAVRLNFARLQFGRTWLLRH